MALATLAQRWGINALQVAATTGNGQAMACPASAKEHSFYIFAASGVTGGAIQIESADDPNFSGTWAPLGAPIAVVASTEIIFNYTGSLIAVRARVSTTISGGGAPSANVNYKPV